MKVTFLNTMDTSGGAARAAFRLLCELRNQQVPARMLVQEKFSDHDFVVSPQNNITKATALLKTTVENIPKFLYTKRKKDRVFHSQWAPGRINSKIKHENPDIVHLHWICRGFVNVATLARLTIPVVWTLHDMWAFTGGCHHSETCEKYTDKCGRCPQLGSRYERDLSRWNWNQKKRLWSNKDFHIVTPSQWLADCAKNSSLFKNRKISVIPNGLDTNTFKPFNKSIARDVFSLPKDKKLILFGAMGATTNELKGFHFLEQSLKIFNRREFAGNMELVVFGTSKRLKRLESNINVTVLGQFYDDILLALLYSACDVFVAPSIVENLPSTVMESMACGTPCVAFEIGGMPDMIKHKANGYLAAPFDVDDLASGIQWTVEDQDLWKRLSNNCIRKAQTEYDISFIAGQYMDLYDQLTHNK